MPNTILSRRLLASPNSRTPTGLDILGSSATSNILLQWNPQRSPTPKRIEIWRGVNGGAYSLLTTVSGGSTSFADTSGIGSGVVWSYKVRAVSNGVPSAFSIPADISNTITSGTGTSFSRPNLVVALGQYAPPSPSTITTFQVPRLHDCTGAIRVLNNAGAVAFDFSSLINCGDLRLTCPVSGSTLAFPSLVTINGSLDLENSGVSSISMPNLTTVTALFQINNQILTSLSFPSLTSSSASGGDLDFTGNTNLTSLSFAAALQYAPGFPGGGYFGAGGTGGFFGASPALVAVNCPLAIFDDSNNIDFSMCALNAASVNLILRRCVVSGLTSSNITLNGGTNAAPSGQGVADKATLQAAGNFVVTN